MSWPSTDDDVDKIQEEIAKIYRRRGKKPDVYVSPIAITAATQDLCQRNNRPTHREVAQYIISQPNIYCAKIDCNDEIAAEEIVLFGPQKEVYFAILQQLWSMGLHVTSLSDLVYAKDRLTLSYDIYTKHVAEDDRIEGEGVGGPGDVADWLISNNKTLQTRGAVSYHYLKKHVSIYFDSLVNKDYAYNYFISSKVNLDFFIRVLEKLEKDGLWVCPSDIFFAIKYGMSIMSSDEPSFITCHPHFRYGISSTDVVKWLKVYDYSFSDTTTHDGDIMRLKNMLHNYDSEMTVRFVCCICIYVYEIIYMSC